MKAKEIMELVDELVRISRDLGNIRRYGRRYGTFGGDTKNRQELQQRCNDIREELQAFADKYERLTENPR